MVQLVPVDNDPFSAPSNDVRLEPVDFDPFAGKDSTKSPTQQLAPASGAFPAVTQGAVDAAIAPQSNAGASAPPPSAAPMPPAQDPGVLQESYGDAVKGYHSAKRGAFLTAYMADMYGDVDNIARHLAASQQIENAYPASQATRDAQSELDTLKDSGASGILPAMGVYARNPRAALSTAIQSLPTMIPTMVTAPVGAVAGSFLGPAGAATGALLGVGAGSAMADFGNSFEDYARDKWKPQSEADWKAILTDPEKYREAGAYAAKHAGMVGAFDALGGKLGGKVGMAVAGRLAELGAGKVARVAGAAGPAIATDAAVGAAGEAAGQLAGSGQITDPGAVAGEFAAGVVTGGATSSIEPVVHQLNIGGKHATPATPEDVAGATAAMIPTPAASDISGTMSRVNDTPTFYSPVRQYVEQKGPGSATVEQWQNTLRNAPGVKQEEMADLNLPDFFANAQGKVTKAELLAHLDENAIQVNETQRVPIGAEEPGMLGLTQQPDNARYEGYTLPGERQGYTELTLHIPTRNIEGDNTQRDFVGGHYVEPNVIAHARVTDRTDINGTPLALIEEIQSDWHQQGRKEGYQTGDVTALQQQYANISDTYDALQNEYRRTQDRATFDRLRELSAQLTQLEDQIGNEPNGFSNVPSGPFKQSWDELAFKRMLRWAADKGYRRVAWVNAAEQMRRYPGGVGAEQRAQGMQGFYDKIIPSIARKWARRLGGSMGETQLYGPLSNILGDPNTGVSTVQHIDLPQAALNVIQRGLPMYSEASESRRKPGATLDELAAEDVKPLGAMLAPALDRVIKGLGLPVEVKLFLHQGGQINVRDERNMNHRIRGALGLAIANSPRGGAEIHVALGYHKTAAEVWATMNHELGHIVFEYKFRNADPAIRVAIRAAFDEFRSNTPHNETMTKLIQRRDNAVLALHGTRGDFKGQTLDSISPDKRQYWMHFEEWFAEQVARWATTDQRPLTAVEHFMKGMADVLKKIAQLAANHFGLTYNPSEAISNWLNSFYTDMGPFAEKIVDETNVKTQADNQRHMGPEEKAVEMQPETVGVRETVGQIFNGRPPKEVQETMAYADKFNKIYKWMLGIHQVAQRNKHIQPLQQYVETLAVAQLTKQQVMTRAMEVLKAWNRLGGKMGDSVAALIDDVQNMVYLTDDEVKNKVARFPTQQEMADLIKKHGVSQEGIQVFKDIASTFNDHLTRYEAVLRNEANKVGDPVEKQKRHDAITRQIATLRSRPYFPAMRFGDFTITVRDAAGKVIHFETFEKERKRNAAADAIRKQYGVSKDQMELGKLDRQTRPLLGVPTQLLELMAAKLELSQKQRDALEQLKFELSPAQSFKHRFQHKTRVAGYSQDFRRAYAAYFFHGANHLMKAMHADSLRALTKATREETKGVYDVTTRHEIVAYMTDHLENWLDPKSDWAAIRSIAALWGLAFTPAAAAQNLTQTLMTTYPFLAQQFGDIKAVAALMKTGANFTTFYRKGTLEGATDVELRAISQGIRDGIINEAMAPELAGYAEGRTLGLGFGGNAVQRAQNEFMHLGMKMFEMAEQVNRRLVFRAAWKLAKENPGNKYAQQMVAKHQLHYDQLRKQGWTEADAQAYVVARDATITTQFQYGREYAPRFMRGKARSIFVFKTFIQNYMVFLANYPQAAVRSLLIMGFLGGLAGIPGWDDLKEILKALGYQMFGKDFDLEREARKWLLDYVGNDENGRERADTILHGISRYGYGIPGVMDMLGGTVGLDGIHLPTFDRSKAISAGTLLPVELGKLFGPPTQDADSVIAAEAQKASGAMFGLGFAAYKAMVNTKLQWDDSKRWQGVVPRAAANVWKSYRIGTEGRERTSTGSTLVKYDVRDPEQLMEVLGMAAGYVPFRQSLQWDRIMAGTEVTKFWDIRRTGLMKQMGNAVLGRDQKEIARVREAIQTFNAGLPTEARGKAITSDSLRQSIGTQARTRRAQEMELSTKRSDVPILREVQKLYPDSRATSVRPVPRNLQ